MRSLRILVCLATLLATSLPVRANAGEPAKTVVHPRLASCAALPEDKRQWMPPAWQPYARFVKLCPVFHRRRPALYVLSVWADELYATMPAEAPAVTLPHPLLLSVSGDTIGELPHGYPRDPPRSLEPGFTDWSTDFPHKVLLWVEDPAVAGSRFLPPLTWNAKSGRFVSTPPRE